MSFKAQIYNGGNTTGGGCPCKTPPTPIDCAASAARNVTVNGLKPVLQGDSMSPEVGVTCTSPPSGCTSPRTVIATGVTVFINGKNVARLSLATSQSWKDKNTGEKKEKTEWHRVVAVSYTHLRAH